MTKGEDTKISILQAGWDMASKLGLESVTIGNLAKQTAMSKSGLFGHFQSKENLQIEILKFAAQDFAENVVIPALRVKAGIPRIKAMVDNWIQWGDQQKGTCIFVSASTEFSDRPGKVREYLLHQQQDWVACLSTIAESAVRSGDFREGIDCDQFGFELYSLLLGFHYYTKLLRDADTKKYQEDALDKLLNEYV